MDVFRQYGVKFTALKPHTVRPGSPAFKANVDEFDRICRVVGGVKGMVVGAIGARTTPFKTVRIDEVTLQRHGVTVETFDLSDIFLRMKAVKPEEAAYIEKAKTLQSAACWEDVPGPGLRQSDPLGVSLDKLAEEARLDAMAIRCWTEMQMQMGISPCVAMGMLNETGFATACEVDLGNAVVMHALHLASYEPSRPAGLEQQLRRRRRKMHPVPLRSAATQPDGRPGTRRGPCHPGELAWSGQKLSAAMLAASSRWTSPLAA